MAANEADRFFTFLENLIKKHIPQVEKRGRKKEVKVQKNKGPIICYEMSEEEKNGWKRQLLEPLQKLPLLQEIDGGEPAGTGREIKPLASPTKSRKKTTSSITESIEFNVPLNVPKPLKLSDSKLPAATVADLKKMGSWAVEEIRQIREQIERMQEHNKQLRTLEKWKKQAKAGRWTRIAREIDLQIGLIELEITHIKRQGTFRRRKSKPYDKVAERIATALGVWEVEYAPFLAGCVLWYSGFSNPEMADAGPVSFKGRDPIGIYNKRGNGLKTIDIQMRNRFRNYTKDTLKYLRTLRDSLPQDYPTYKLLYDCFNDLIGGVEQERKLPRRKRALEERKKRWD